MKKIYFTLLSTVILSAAFAQISVVTSTVPQFMQGVSPTNNNRIPMYFWVELSGLTPGATYRYYTALDSIGVLATSNGAGIPYLLNMTSGTVRRTSSPSLSNPLNYDSLTATIGGSYSGWFGIEPTGNGRFTPGKKVYPQINMNNGLGGTTIANRIKLTTELINVITFSTTVSPLYGSAIYDSASVSNVPAKSLVFIYDNSLATGRPLSSAIVEAEGVTQNTITSVASFYRNLVDLYPQRWGTIIPNQNGNGVRAIQYLGFGTGQQVYKSDHNSGYWCSGANTQNPSNGSTALFIDENFSLQTTIMSQPTANVGDPVPFMISTNAPMGTTFTWDFGDGSALDFGMNPIHTYTASGNYMINLITQAPGCGTSTITTITISGVTGLNSNTKAINDVLIYPNPNNGNFTISTNNSTLNKVIIYNVLGKKVQEININENKTIQINLHNKGVYFIELTDNTGNTRTEKIIVN